MIFSSIAFIVMFLLSVVLLRSSPPSSFSFFLRFPIVLRIYRQSLFLYRPQHHTNVRMELNESSSSLSSCILVNPCQPLRIPITRRQHPLETLLSLLLRRNQEPVDYDSIYSVFAPQDVATFQLLADSLEDLDTVKDLLDRGASVHVCDSTNSTPLLRATRGGRFRIVELLLQSGANPAHKDFTGLTALVWATHYGDIPLIRLLLEHYADSAALMVATERNMPEVVRVFCSDARMDVNFVNEQGTTPLIHACNFGFREVVNELLQHPGILVNAADESQATALLWACRHNQLDIITTLLESGANVNQPDKSGDTPLLLATKCCYLKVVELLLRYGADANVHDLYGTTVLLAACEQDSVDLVKLILPRVQNVEQTDSYHLSPLFLATDRGNLEIVTQLLRAGASIHESADEFTPFLLAIAQGRSDIMKKMLDYGGSKYSDDPTPLQTAISADELDLIYILLRSDPVAQIRNLARL